MAEAGYRYVLLVGEDYWHASAWLHPRFTLHAKSRAEGHARALGWFRRRSGRNGSSAPSLAS